LHTEIKITEWNFPPELYAKPLLSLSISIWIYLPILPEMQRKKCFASNTSFGLGRHSPSILLCSSESAYREQISFEGDSLRAAIGAAISHRDCPLGGGRGSSRGKKRAGFF
jgi:hypothetical protein